MVPLTPRPITCRSDILAAYNMHAKSGSFEAALRENTFLVIMAACCVTFFFFCATRCGATYTHIEASGGHGGSGTSGMLNHLVNKHPLLFAEMDHKSHRAGNKLRKMQGGWADVPHCCGWNLTGILFWHTRAQGGTAVAGVRFYCLGGGTR